LTVSGEIEKRFAGFVVEDERADGDLHGEAFAFVAGSVAAFAVAAALSGVFGVEAEMEKRVAVDGGDHGNVAAASAIAAAGAAARHVFLTTESEAAIAAVTRLDCNVDFVD